MKIKVKRLKKNIGDKPKTCRRGKVIIKSLKTFMASMNVSSIYNIYTYDFAMTIFKNHD